MGSKPQKEPNQIVVFEASERVYAWYMESMEHREAPTINEVLEWYLNEKEKNAKDCGLEETSSLSTTQETRQ